MSQDERDEPTEQAPPRAEHPLSGRHPGGVRRSLRVHRGAGSTACRPPTSPRRSATRTSRPTPSPPALSAARQFGLLTLTGEGYSLTPLAREILHPVDPADLPRLSARRSQAAALRRAGRAARRQEGARRRDPRQHPLSQPPDHRLGQAVGRRGVPRIRPVRRRTGRRQRLPGSRAWPCRSRPKRPWPAPEHCSAPDRIRPARAPVRARSSASTCDSGTATTARSIRVRAPSRSRRRASSGSCKPSGYSCEWRIRPRRSPDERSIKAGRASRIWLTRPEVTCGQIAGPSRSLTASRSVISSAAEASSRLRASSSIGRPGTIDQVLPSRVVSGKL